MRVSSEVTMGVKRDLVEDYKFGEYSWYLSSKYNRVIK